MGRRTTEVEASLDRTVDERGATATEYGLLVGFIALIIVAGVGLFGVALGQMFEDFATWLAATI